MRATTIICAALAAGLGIGLGGGLGLGTTLLAQEEPVFLGAPLARSYTDSYKMSTDVGADGDWKAPARIDERRRRVHVSELYGELVDMTPHGDAVVLWFKDGDGVVRNAVLPGVTSTLYDVRRAPARRIGITYR